MVEASIETQATSTVAPVADTAETVATQPVGVIETPVVAITPVEASVTLTAAADTA